MKNKQKSFTQHYSAPKSSGMDLSSTTFSTKSGAGFTLIEILVVIAIVGILASVVTVVALKIREKARIVTLLQFSSTIHNALGSEIVGGWSFDEGGYGTCAGGADFCDNSGYGNHGINNGIVEWENNEITELGKAVCFDAIGDYIQIDLLDSFEDRDAFTIETWVKPTAGFGAINFIIIEADTDYILALMDDGEVAFSLAPFAWVYTGYNLQIGKWYHILVAYSGSEEIKMFINAEEVKTENIVGSANQTIWDSTFYIGERFGIGSFNGCVDNLSIYNSKLGISQIQKLYAEGVMKRGLAVK